MKTRVIFFSRVPSQSPEGSPGIVFGRWGESLELELPQAMGVEEFSQNFGFKRHSKFDHTVGEMGRKATLIEVPESLKVNSVALPDSRILSLSWEIFPVAARALVEGADRRFLQLAVQFLAAGESVDDSVIAADYDAEFLQQLQKTLVEQNKNKDE
jgi:hypothetical protein